MQPLDDMTRMMLLEIIEDRHQKCSTIIASQLPIDKWYDVIGENTIADAILDRLVHTSHRIELSGESMRIRKKCNFKKFLSVHCNPFFGCPSGMMPPARGSINLNGGSICPE